MCYADSILIVDLTNGSIEKRSLSDELKTGYIGGQGISARLLYDFITPGIEPLSADNVMVFGAGLLCGTMMPTAARACAMAKSPQTNRIAISNAGGMGVMMKYAGYDHVIIKGKADKPVFLKIENDHVEIQDASHLWGKDVIDTTELLWQDLGEHYWISCIGQAGENLVRFSVIMNNKWHAFGRTGFGAIMGSKNLKAIATYGTKGIKVSDRRRFMQIADETIEAMLGNPLAGVYRSGGTHEWSLRGTEDQPPLIQPSPHVFEVHKDGLLDINKYFEHLKIMPAPCYVCPIGCRHWLESLKGENKGQMFGVSCSGGTMIGAYGFGTDVASFSQVAMITELGQRLGLSSHETSAVLWFVMKLYEEDVITKDDTEGLEMTWGNADSIRELMRKIADRKGFGDLLADGIPMASQRIGETSEPYVVSINPIMMGGGQFPFSIRAESFISALSHDRARYPREYFATVGKKGIRRFALHVGISEEDIDNMLAVKDYNIPLFASYVIPYNLMVQSFGTCDRSIAHKSLSMDRYSEIYSAATGLEMSTMQLQQAGLRAWYLERAFNLREGTTPSDDLARLTPKGNSKGRSLLEEFYQAIGCDKETGKPTREKLQELNLEYIADDLGV